jgi:hypothetical protein
MTNKVGNTTTDESGMSVITDSTGDITITSDYVTMSNDTSLDINDYYGHTIDISTITTSTIDTTGFDELLSMDDISITIPEPVEFEDRMPTVAKVEDMCNDYPALKKAYEQFKSIYAMVHQDWKGRQEAGDDQMPF